MRKWSEVTGFWQKLPKKEEVFSGKICHSSSCSPNILWLLKPKFMQNDFYNPLLSKYMHCAQ